MAVREFPRRIFQIWYQGEAALKPLFAESVRNWQLLNPGWTHELLDADGLRAECWAYSADAGRTYDAMTLLHHKVDFARFVLLARHGGIYVDMDCYPLRSLDGSRHVREFIERHEAGEDVVGLSHALVTQVEALLYSGARVQLNNGIVMSSPGHPLTRGFVRNMMLRFHANPDADVEAVTGPSAVNDFFLPHYDVDSGRGSGGLVVFPATLFEPCDLNSVCLLTDDTVALHKYELSWVSGPLKAWGKAYMRHRAVLWTLVAVALAACAVWAVRRLRARGSRA